MILSDKAFFTWLFGASFSMMMLWMVYVSFFRSWTFFEINRFILIGGTCVCLILPLVSSKMIGELLIPGNAARGSEFNMLSINSIEKYSNNVDVESTIAMRSFDWLWLTMVIIYWSGVVVMLIRSYRAFNQLRIIKQEAELIQHNHISTVWTQQRLPSFSFGRHIYLNINTLLLSTQQQATIRQHEEAHVLQKHSIDNVIFEFVNVIFWFNPFARKLAKNIRDVHEFLADRWALSGLQKASDYQELLVKLASGIPANRITHNFSNSQLFRRLIMLHKSRTNIIESLKLLFLIPAIGIAMLMSACIDEEKSNLPYQQGIIPGPASAPVISKITWTGNKLHSTDELSELLGVKPGDRYDRRRFENMIDRGVSKHCITNLYMNDGYLFFRTEINDKLNGGTVELSIDVQEGERVWINDVNLSMKNGVKVDLDELEPLIDIKKGQLFNRALLLSSQEKLAKSGLVRSDKVVINPLPLAMETSVDKRLVNFEFLVQAP